MVDHEHKLGLKLVRLGDRNAGVGAAVRLMMTLPAYENRPFGQLVRALDSQAERNHQLFALDENARLRGYIGYAYADQASAEDWLAGRRSLLSDDCVAGDCIIFNFLIAADRTTLRFLWDACRQLSVDKRNGYYKRARRDGSVRPVRLAITSYVAKHVERNARVSGGLL